MYLLIGFIIRKIQYVQNYQKSNNPPINYKVINLQKFNGFKNYLKLFTNCASADEKLVLMVINDLYITNVYIFWVYSI